MISILQKFAIHFSNRRQSSVEWTANIQPMPRETNIWPNFYLWFEFIYGYCRVFFTCDMIRLTVNKPSVSAEAFENEVVAVNLISGNYYSILHSGFDIWQMIERQFSRAQILDQFAESVQSSEITPFIDQLLALGLVREQDSEVVNPDNYDLLSDYQKPVIEEYSDMQELLLLDPIHEVDETGWPKPMNEDDKKS